MKRNFKMSFVAGSLLLVVLLSACGSTTGNDVSSAATPQATTVPTTAPTATMQATVVSPSSAVPAGFTQFKGDGFTLAYPNGWTHEQSGNYYTFARSDNVTQFLIGLHNTDKDPCAFLQHAGFGLNCTRGDVAGITHSPSVTVNGITWKQDDWRAYLSNVDYVMRQLTYVNPQTNDTTTIVYAGYAEVASPNLVTFDQATSKYFQPMLQSFRFQ